jgi:O-methyltransferase
MFGKLINCVLKKAGYKIEKIDPKQGLEDIFSDKGFSAVYDAVNKYTMTSPQRLYALYKSVEYVVSRGIQGDFVECGVWRGGSAMAMALTLKKMGVTDRKIFLYDTYEGMSAPTEKDKDIHGTNASILLEEQGMENKGDNVWCYASIEDVTTNVKSTGYPEHSIHILKGKVEDTIPATIPEKIALLRLDTDWYESTAHELLHLYPLLESKGVLIIDDYGHWQGARQAVDEYIANNKLPLLLNRIDYTGRLALKY